jgi:predicted DNA-binding protein (UPF0251 family)
MPEKTFFQPEGVAPSTFEAVLLTLDEYEAIRLADLEGLYQEQATRMSVSRRLSVIVEAALEDRRRHRAGRPQDRVGPVSG